MEIIKVSIVLFHGRYLRFDLCQINRGECAANFHFESRFARLEQEKEVWVGTFIRRMRTFDNTDLLWKTYFSLVV